MLALISIFGFLCILYAIGSFVMGIISSSNKRQNAQRGSGNSLPIYTSWPLKYPALALGILLFVIPMFITKISATEVGVIVTPGGVSPEPIKTGWHIIAPWNNVYKLNKTAQVYTFANSSKEGNKTYEDAIWTPTSEGIKLGYDISVNYQIDEDKAPWIYSNIPGSESEEKYKWIEENVIRSSTKMCLSTVVKDYTVTNAYTVMRDSIQHRVNLGLRKLLSEKHIILFETGIREVHYNVDYEKAINLKKLAEQEALRLVDVTKQKEELLKQSKIDKDMVIQTAQGEAEALKIKGSSISTNPKVIELQLIEKWNGVLPTYMMGGSSGVLFNITK